VISVEFPEPHSSPEDPTSPHEPAAGEPIRAEPAPAPPAPVARSPARTWGEIVLVFAPLVLAGSILSKLGITRLEGSLAGSLTVLLSIGIATALLRRQGRTWADYGLAAHPSWRRTLGIALLLLIGTMGVTGIVQLLIRSAGVAPPDYSRFAAIRGNPKLLAMTLAIAWGTAAFGEEMLVRGFLLNRLAEMWGQSRTAWTGALFASSALFGAAHFYQGLSGMLLTGTIGLVFGTVYLAVGRNLWVTILAHGAIDTISLIALYAGAGG